MSDSNGKPIRAALYLRVSTSEQTVENQLIALTDEATRRGWQVVGTYEDAGISGAKSRGGRPGLDKMLTEAVQGRFDVLMIWHIDRLGRSLRDLLDTLQELQTAHVELYVQQQGIDTRTPGGRMIYQVLGVFAEFERSMIQARVHAGLDRRRREGKSLGRPKVGREKDPTVRKARKDQRDTAIQLIERGDSLNSVMRATGLGSSAVQRLAKDVKASSPARTE